jgi:hypothetical protein
MGSDLTDGRQAIWVLEQRLSRSRHPKKETLLYLFESVSVFQFLIYVFVPAVAGKMRRIN